MSMKTEDIGKEKVQSRWQRAVQIADQVKQQAVKSMCVIWHFRCGEVLRDPFR